MASWAVGLQALTFKQKVQGTVSCGVLTASPGGMDPTAGSDVRCRGTLDL